MRGANGTSWNNKRLHVVAFALQIKKHLLEVHTAVESNEAVHVLSDDPCRPESRYNAQHLRPEPTVIVRAASSSGVGSRLTRESAGDDVDPFEMVGSAVSNVGEPLRVREALGEDGLAVRISLDLPDGGKPGPGKPEIEPADASEQAAMSYGPRWIAHRLPI